MSKPSPGVFVPPSPPQARVPRPFERVSLARQFLLASALVLMLAVAATGPWVANLIEASVVNRTAGMAAVYCESFLAGHLDELLTQGAPGADSQRMRGEIFVHGSLAQKVVRVIAAELPCTHVLVLTASSDGDELPAALKVGAKACVPKSVSALELRDMVQRVADGESCVPPALAGRVLGEFARARNEQAAAALTTRAAEVVQRLAQGLTKREIGLQLHLAERTVKQHVTQLLNKLHVRSRTEAALLALRQGRRVL